MNSEKIIGWILLAVGIAIIAWGIFYSFNIFTGKAEPPAIFKVVATNTTTSPKGGGLVDIQGQLGNIVSEQLKGILPLDFLPKLFNLICWSIFMWILVFSSGKIADIGIKLLKKNKES